MKEGSPIPIGWRPILAHAATVGVTLLLVAVLFGDRLGLRQPPLVQIPGFSRQRVSPVPPAPQPVSPSRTRSPNRTPPTLGPERHLHRPRTGSRASTPTS